jgi:hypothetical protein
MKKLVKYSIIANIFLGLLFVYANYALWDSVNAEYPYLIASHWSPLGIVAPHYILNDNTIAMVQTAFLYWNTPFWIFFLLMAVNLYFVIKLARTKESSQKIV